MHSRPPSELPCPLPTAGQTQPVQVPSPGPGPTPQLGGLAQRGGVWAHLQLTGAPLAAATTAVARPLRGDETAQPVTLLGQAGVQLLGGVGDGQWGAGQDAHAPAPPGG